MQNNEPNIEKDIPVFPLPSIVFFPWTLLPLRIFEERYVRMVEGALASDRLIGMANFKEGWEKKYFQNPDIIKSICVGKIVKHERLVDGKFNILLSGLSRAEILSENFERPYRTGRVRIIEELVEPADLPSATKLAKGVVSLWEKSATVKKLEEVELPDLENLDESALACLSHRVGNALHIEMRKKIELRDKSSVRRRLEWEYAALSEVAQILKNGPRPDSFYGFSLS